MNVRANGIRHFFSPLTTTWVIEKDAPQKLAKSAKDVPFWTNP